MIRAPARFHGRAAVSPMLISDPCFPIGFTHSPQILHANFRRAAQYVARALNLKTAVSKEERACIEQFSGWAGNERVAAGISSAGRARIEMADRVNRLVRKTKFLLASGARKRMRHMWLE